MSGFAICSPYSYCPGPNYSSLRSIVPSRFSVIAPYSQSPGAANVLTFNPNVYAYGYYNAEMGFPFYYKSYDFIGKNFPNPYVMP